MDQTTLLLDFLKEQYTQRRQHELSQTNATTFLTGAAGVVLGFALKEGLSGINAFAAGLVVFLIGAVNWRINRAHSLGSRFRDATAGKTLQALENAIQGWTVETPTEIRKAVLAEKSMKGFSRMIHSIATPIPIATMLLGILVALASTFYWVK